MKTVVFDRSNPNWSDRSGLNRMWLTSMERYFNNKLTAIGYLLLNDVLEDLGYEPEEEYVKVGWVMDGNVSFGDDLNDSSEVTPIELNFNTNSNNVFQDRENNR